MINNEHKDGMQNDLPFKLNVSHYRRKKIMDAITGDRQEKKE